jgi:hypothetical protein
MKRTPFVVRFFGATPKQGWIAIAIAATITLVLLPALHLLVPPGSPFHVSA